MFRWGKPKRDGGLLYVIWKGMEWVAFHFIPLSSILGSTPTLGRIKGNVVSIFNGELHM